MSELTWDDLDLDAVLAAYRTGDPAYCSMVDQLAEAGVPWAADVQNAAALDDDPLVGVDQGALEALLLEGRQDGALVIEELRQLSEEGHDELVYRILELAAADDQEWAGRLLHRSELEEDAAWNEEVAGRTFDPDKFDKAAAAAAENDEPEAAHAYYVTNRLEPDPPEIGVTWAEPHEALGSEDNRHKISAHSDPLDIAFAEFFAENRNRENGHPQALEPDPEIQGDPMVRANLDAVAASMTDELARSERLHRHAQEVQRKGTA